VGHLRESGGGHRRAGCGVARKTAGLACEWRKMMEVRCDWRYRYRAEQCNVLKDERTRARSIPSFADITCSCHNGRTIPNLTNI
jgi:hypothetical protein